MLTYLKESTMNRPIIPYRTPLWPSFGLTSPGGSATYSVYVVLTTGNVKGSTPMTMVRPG